MSVAMLFSNITKQFTQFKCHTYFESVSSGLIFVSCCLTSIVIFSRVAQSDLQMMKEAGDRRS